MRLICERILWCIHWILDQLAIKIVLLILAISMLVSLAIRWKFIVPYFHLAFYVIPVDGCSALKSTYVFLERKAHYSGFYPASIYGTFHLLSLINLLLYVNVPDAI